MTNKRDIAVIGAGLMGHGIALTFARAGCHVYITDPMAETLATVKDRVAESLKLMGVDELECECVLAKIRPVDTLAAAVSGATAVFEAAPEKLELKQSIFAQLEEHAPEDAILASNTSVIQISKIMEGLTTRHRAVGTHWWNPPHMIPLVEVIKTEWTDPSVAQCMHDLLAEAGKTPVMVEKDVPGFIGNRLQHALWREAISLVENGICSAKAVDDVVKASFGRRLAVLGPLENADLVGIELTHDIHAQVLFDLETTPDPSPYLQKLRDEGRDGMASGKGFRDWNEGDLEATKARVAQHLKKLEAILPH
ncbi:3-hydroxyacyl-CoA dehydrogenase NAD-binding domain-containing protein [Octadecabacter sp. CECT 8868]|uniref:3-hydroxyacyl-CoA dehydrogenase family protein n=1 Tax=Octadecabacter algicola TaxID=2909342 RepID=UPI001F398181|nr:3-hydroxyacyl-CoA dehydrogenase NAD-binding domain-containing protein [Octadecabacter algicola]MCF2904658.1 3-hydroxyacyl-CoA dehydrogenase NAD-binding domain-containing protein [Octadecabacter algicola]